MKLYITKPRHSKYGFQTIENPYSTIDELINDSTIWFEKPSFVKPIICDLFGDLVWNGYRVGIFSVSVKFEALPDNDIKVLIYKMIKETISDDFSELKKYRYYNWVGEIDVNITQRDTPGNFNLFLTKPEVLSIRHSGMEDCCLWFEKPTYNRTYYGIKTEGKNYYYRLSVKNKGCLSGKMFVKNEELYDIGMSIWYALVNSFDVPYDESDVYKFYMALNDRNHKKGQSSKMFCKEIYLDIESKN